MATPIFDDAHPKIIEITFRCPEFAPVCKKSVCSICSFMIQSNLEFSDQTGHTHFLTLPTQKHFDQILIYVNLRQCAKTQAISLIYSGDMID